MVETSKRPTGRREVATAMLARLQRGDLAVDLDDLQRSLDAGLTALKHWKHAQSRRPEPRELAPREVVNDFLAADLPQAARALLTAEASDVLMELTTTLSEHRVRPGVRELLDLAHARGIGVGIVSNAHSGRSHRHVLAREGLDRHIAVQCYSDEVGLRKPHPGIIELAAQALGTVPARCWYVGDTQDRDVVAGRRAGVAAVILTRSHHTDDPPFAVADRADAVLDDPRGLLPLLAQADPASAAPVAVAEPRDRGALLIDHGGVVTTSERDPEALADFGDWLAELLGLAGGNADARRLIVHARTRHRDWKRSHLGAPGDHVPEIEPVRFWRDWAGETLDSRRRALLQAEAHEIMARYGEAKSRRRPRPGMVQVLQQARDDGLSVVVVSNTVSGRSVRSSCREAGLEPYVAAHVCSDEIGARKPDPVLVQEALRIADADPARTWFVGDKPSTDARAALTAGIAHRVLLHGGATGEEDLAAALAHGLATAVARDPYELLTLMAGAPAAV